MNELETKVTELKATEVGHLLETTRELTNQDLTRLFARLKASAGTLAPEVDVLRVGHVLSVSDGVAIVDGLSTVMYNEMVRFPNDVYGLAMNLADDHVGVILFGDFDLVEEGDLVYRTGQLLDVPVGDGLLGRVVDALGAPIDERGEIAVSEWRPIEADAPDIISRQAIHKPLQTGILAIDAMIPIGRGQRELIIGDRQTGKTSIAIETILNQKDEDVICIYVAIGQKASGVRQIVSRLEKAGAMSYTVIVAAMAGDPSAMLYVAPYAACTMAEYFMYAGRDVLIVYDDLSKQAVAYRELSLLLRRPPGREAYPGDIFYLHSRLLERSAQLSEAKGGGSLTSLPIIETQFGDVSSYIPTNVISITDGQIFLDTDLFNEGQRPAVSVGVSVSRVGGSAQIKAMKQVAGRMRIDLAQYRELLSFTSFGSDLDGDARQKLRRGQVLVELTRQDVDAALSVEEQVVLLNAATKGYFDDLERAAIRPLRDRFLEYMRQGVASSILTDLKRDKALSQPLELRLEAAITHFFDTELLASEGAGKEAAAGGKTT